MPLIAEREWQRRLVRSSIHAGEVKERMVTVQVEESEMPQKGDPVRGNSGISQTYEFYRS